MKISESLRNWRKREGLSQPKAAAKLGVGLATFRPWEQGRREPHGAAWKAEIMRRIK